MPRMKRQGDVLLIAVAQKAVRGRKALPLEAGRVVLAHGEATGHAHAVDGRKASLYLEEATKLAPDVLPMLALGGGLPGDRLLTVREKTEVRHEEHARIPLKKGEKFIVRRQRQYQWGRAQRVAD